MQNDFLRKVQFSQSIDPELFNTVAKETAKTIAAVDKKRNKPTQLRRFYDELCLWQAKVEQQPEKFAEYLPFILMLNAKVAYAEGRELVDKNFMDLFAHCLKQVNDVKTLRYAKLFFEAFLGFYKAERPKEN